MEKREQELEAGARRVHPRWRCGTRENLSEQAEQAREECPHDDGGMMEVVEPGQTCRWRLKEVEEDVHPRRDVG
jgi:hypothetical protein